MQAETATNRLLDSFPPSFIVGSCIFGLVMLFLSPLKFVLNFPYWLLNPIQTTQGSEVLGRLGAIILLSFPFGIPLSFLDVFFVRTSGYNEKINEKILKPLRSMFDFVKQYLVNSDKTQIPTPMADNPQTASNSQKETRIPDHVFHLWLKKKKYLQDFQYLVVSNTIVNDLIVGSEIAIILNLIWLPFAIFFKYQLVNYAYSFVASIIILIVLWYYNKKYWNNQLQVEFQAFKTEFDKDNSNQQTNFAIR